MDAMAKERKFAFDAFLGSLAAFQSSFVSELSRTSAMVVSWCGDGASRVELSTLDQDH
jgi:hypothetical protein